MFKLYLQILLAHKNTVRVFSVWFTFYERPRLLKIEALKNASLIFFNKGDQKLYILFSLLILTDGSVSMLTTVNKNARFCFK